MKIPNQYKFLTHVFTYLLRGPVRRTLGHIRGGGRPAQLWIHVENYLAPGAWPVAPHELADALGLPDAAAHCTHWLGACLQEMSKWARAQRDMHFGVLDASRGADDHDAAWLRAYELQRVYMLTSACTRAAIFSDEELRRNTHNAPQRFGVGDDLWQQLVNAWTAAGGDNPATWADDALGERVIARMRLALASSSRSRANPDGLTLATTYFDELPEERRKALDTSWACLLAGPLVFAATDAMWCSLPGLGAYDEVDEALLLRIESARNANLAAKKEME